MSFVDTLSKPTLVDRVSTAEDGEGIDFDRPPSDAFSVSLLSLMLPFSASSSSALSGLGLAVAFLHVFLTPSLHAQSTASPGTLTVEIVGLDSDDGTVQIALNDETNYEGEGNVRAASLPIDDGTAHWTVPDVSPGTYVVRLYHDANGNGELDTNMFGVPQEAFGFSNDARGRFGPPDFDEAAFTLPSDALSITVTAK